LWRSGWLAASAAESEFDCFALEKFFRDFLAINPVQDGSLDEATNPTSAFLKSDLDFMRPSGRVQ
jgi:hypothetical protein